MGRPYENAGTKPGVCNSQAHETLRRPCGLFILGLGAGESFKNCGDAGASEYGCSGRGLKTGVAKRRLTRLHRFPGAA